MLLIPCERAQAALKRAPRFRFLVIAAAAAFLTLCPALGELMPAAPSGAARPEPGSARPDGGDGERPGAGLRIAGVTYLGDLPTLIADRRGLFAKAGVAASVTYGISGKTNLERLRAGEVDFALMALTPPVIDLLVDPSPGGGDDPVILASLVHSGLLNKVVTLKSSGLDRAEDLVGRRVGVMRGTNVEVAWWLFSRYHGLGDGAVEVLDLPMDRLGDALLDETVDAAVLWEPWAAGLERRALSGTNVLPGSEVYVAKWALVTRRATVVDSPAACAALLRAYRKAIDYIERYPAEALREYSHRVSTDPEVVRRDGGIPFYDLNLDWSLVSSLQQQFAWAREAGYERGARERSVMQLLAPEPLRAFDAAAVAVPPATHARQGRGR